MVSMSSIMYVYHHENHLTKKWLMQTEKNCNHETVEKNNIAQQEIIVSTCFKHLT